MLCAKTLHVRCESNDRNYWRSWESIFRRIWRTCDFRFKCLIQKMFTNLRQTGKTNLNLLENKWIVKLSIPLFQVMNLTYFKYHKKSKQTKQGNRLKQHCVVFSIFLSCVRHVSLTWKISLDMRTRLRHHISAPMASFTEVPSLI